MKSNKIKSSLYLGILFVIFASPNFGVNAQALANPDTIKYILTPVSGSKPKINGAKVYGLKPNSPLMYRIAATGNRPMIFSASNLPKGLALDKETGILTGKILHKGTYKITIQAKNSLGIAQRELRLVVGDEISLTPLMGCNTYGGWGPFVNEKNIRDAANALVSTDLINHGYSFVNIDDGWQGTRGGKYNAIQPNEKFSDMKQLADDVHKLGLKLGIYTSPWTSTYEGFIGSSSDNANGAWIRPNPPRSGTGKFGKFIFYENDTKQWAEWGIDYCKFDWKIDSVFRVKGIRDAIDKTGRDIILEISNNGKLVDAAEMTKVANMTRTTDDIIDVWENEQLDSHVKKWGMSIRDIWRVHNQWQSYNRPGHWNMPCPLRVGMLGGWDLKPLRPTRLSPNEQYSHISLWCLWSAPLIIGCPPERLDAFTLSLLSNDEVIEINQDPLGQQAKQIAVEKGEVLIKNLEDGSMAVGLFNTNSTAEKISVNWQKIGLKGKLMVRDLWRQKDLGVFNDGFSTEVPPHGVVLVKIKKKK